MNRLLRTGNLSLLSAGDLSGTVQEIRWGAPDAARRARLESETESQRRRELQNMMGSFLVGLAFQGYKIENVDDHNKGVVVSYAFLSRGYAKQAGPLLLVRPRVIGEKSIDLDEEKGKTRKYPASWTSR